MLVTGLADGTVALVLVLHHALADGIGGLAVLTNLVDAGASQSSVSFPRPAPAALALARDAFRARLLGLRHSVQSWHMLRASMGAGGGLHPPRAAPCSLNQRTGPSHVRGPVEPVTFGGFAITSAIPVGLAEGGNVTVYFEVLSYAGALTVTVISDPDRFPDLGLLTDALRAELNQIIQPAALP